MRLISLFWVVLPLLCTFCSSGGIGHEGEAKITGLVAYASSEAPLAGIPVYMHSVDFSKDTSNIALRQEPCTFTDNNGFFSLFPPSHGRFVIEINDDQKYACCIKTETTAEKTTVDLPPDTLRHTGAIRGKLILPTTKATDIFVQVLGLDRIAKLDPQTDSFFLSDMPFGNYQLRIITSEPAMAPKTIDNITVHAGGITSFGFSCENIDTIPPQSLRVFLNTTASGAPIASDLFDFPVLVRLSGDNFDFSTAREDGSDMRCLDEKEQPLPFEIERWDSNRNIAEIWVTIDTMHADNSLQFFYLQWGKTPGSHHHPGSPFDTAAGFQAVWHLADKPGDTIKDATINNFFGIPYGLSETSPVPGVVGPSVQLDGNSQYISMPTTADSKLNFPENSNFSLSAWVYIDTFTSNYQSFLSKSNQLYGLGLSDQNVVEFFEFESEDSWKTNSGKAEKAQWILITGISKGDRQFLYFNDICTDSTAEPIGGKKYRVTTDPVTIGKRTSSSVEGWFNGRLDEIRIYNRALSADWIKCCYINQSSDDKLTRILH